MTNFRVGDYRVIQENVRAIKVTAENADDVAKWCGGSVDRIGKPSDPTDVFIKVKVPSLLGAQDIRVGEYVVHTPTDGRFFGMEADKFEAKYMKLGTRGVYEEEKFTSPSWNPPAPEEHKLFESSEKNTWPSFGKPQL